MGYTVKKHILTKVATEWRNARERKRANEETYGSDGHIVSKMEASTAGKGGDPNKPY